MAAAILATDFPIFGVIGCTFENRRRGKTCTGTIHRAFSKGKTLFFHPTLGDDAPPFSLDLTSEFVSWRYEGGDIVIDHQFFGQFIIMDVRI